MLAQRLRRWPNINPALAQRLVFAGKCVHDSLTCITNGNNLPEPTDTRRSQNDVLMLAHRLLAVPTLEQHRMSVSCLVGVI